MLRLTISNLLRLLLGAMLLVLIAALLVPTLSAIRDRNDAARVVANARAGQSVFAVLQFLRPERGTIAGALEAPLPAEPRLMTDMASLRRNAAPAIEAMLRDCAAAACDAKDMRLQEVQDSFRHLDALRQDADAALREPLAQRPRGLTDRWNAGISDTIDRIEHLSATLTERVRLVDGPIAELMAIKQQSWIVRSAAGFERNSYGSGINSGTLSGKMLVQIAGYHGQVQSAWASVRELTARQGAPGRVLDAMRNATDVYFGSVENARQSIFAALTGGKPSPVPLADWMRITNAGLDSLIAVPTAAVAEAQAYAERRAADANRRLWQQIGLLVLGVVLGGSGLVLVQRRVSRPIGAITATMRRLAQGDTQAAIAGQDRHDEIGAMAAAVVVFRDGMLDSARLAAERETERERATRERQAALLDMARTIETETQSVLDEAAQRTGALSGIADAMTGSATRTGTSAQDVARVAGEAMATVQAVASAAEELSVSIRGLGAQAGHASDAVGRAVAAGGETRDTIAALNTKVGQIGSVADMIGEIAARTNLLALNATIEAARAGEAGKGFAVVASEVKALATQTARSTQEIGRHIGEVRGATGASVAAVQRIEATIRELEGIATSIGAAIEQQGAATAEIAHSMNDTGAAMNRMTGRADELSQEASANAQHAGEVRDTAASLNTAIGGMKHTVTRIVRTSTQDVDRRHEVRHRLNRACRLTVADGSLAGVLQDISCGGAAVTGVRAMPEGTRGRLGVDGIQADLPFVVRMFDEGQVLHLSFDLDSRTEATLHRWLDALPQAA